MSEKMDTSDTNESAKSPSDDGNQVKLVEETNKEILPGYATFDDFVKAGFNVLKAGIKAANTLPSGENFSYYSCFPTFRDVRHEEIKKILTTMDKIVKCTGASGSIKRGEVEDKLELLIEANDILLDRANVCMDEEAGISKKPDDVELITTQAKQTNYGSWNTSIIQQGQKPSTNNSQEIRLLAGKHVLRPQLSFKDKIDNSSKPWVPRIKDKPNAMKPLSIYLIETETGTAYCHPYEWELENFTPSDEQLTKTEPIKYKSLDETPIIVIEKPQDLKILIEDLRKYNEIAVDLEHHSYRTFQGITCLMQISTRDTDYLIDTLTLRSELHVLNEIFTKPTVLKVFHGADNDIQWLQRDLSLYIVNMFDTHQAAKHLNLSYLSLAYLLKTYCNIDPNKHFQLADWRIRPLPAELMKYAREDTHYLLYIKDILRNALIDMANGQSNILKATYDRSTDVCKRIYEKPVCEEDTYMTMYRKSQKMFNNRQLFALKELYLWRDQVARQEDDSYGYVLPNHMLLNIAETLPKEMQGILACCNPIPPLVRQHLLKLHKLILKAREQPLIRPVHIEQDMMQRLAVRNQVTDNAEGWMWIPHDITNVEIQPNLPCLLDSKNTQQNQTNSLEMKPKVTIFNSPPTSDDETPSEISDRLKKTRTLFVSPFERYKRVLPMVAALEEKERLKKEKEEQERAAAKNKESEETQESIDRVHEHFLKVTLDKTNENQGREPISSMPGSKKRKRETEISDNDEDNDDSDDDNDVEIIDERICNLSTPKPGRDSTIADGFKNKRFKQEQRQQQKLNNIHKKNAEKAVKGVRVFAGSTDKVKVQKMKNRKELAKKGMLPTDNFDYQAVNFESFQGGSKNASAKTATFQQKQFKDKISKGKKKKKQKLGI